MTPPTLRPRINPGTPHQTRGPKLLSVRLALNLPHPYHHNHLAEENVQVISVLTLFSAKLYVPVQSGQSEQPQLET